MNGWDQFWATWNSVWGFFASFAANTIPIWVIVFLWSTTAVVWAIRRNNTRLGMGQFIAGIILYGFGSLFLWIAGFMTDPQIQGWLVGAHNVLILLSYLVSLFNFFFVWFRKKTRE